ncbi:MAG: hypothetical protein LQ351_003176 [Letrouitia transgressa]|nr:MAG: hypothetical protein LQ351_003176 [Letrouitia transgressa]
MATFNEQLVERFGKGPARFAGQESTSVTRSQLNPLPTVNYSIRQYVNGKFAVPGTWGFTDKREIPTQDEILTTDDPEDLLKVPRNEVVGPWPSKLKYLYNHYELLREDAIAPLRSVVSEMRAEPHTMEKDSVEDSHIYEKTYMTSFTFSRNGIAARVTFSLRRVGKKVLWEQSKRLLPGTLVALTPANDMFQTICKVAVIASRPLVGVQQNPPEVDIYFASPDEIEIDPQQEWVMVESAVGYFEAQRHTLKSLQKMAVEAFPMAEYIVGLERNIQPPYYLKRLLSKDINNQISVDIPEDGCGLDDSQASALHRMLSKELAIVQGPPGTGKTHVSVIALKLLLQKLKPGDPPIIIAAHTNHALDQLLRHIAKIEPDFIRLGGMTLDKEIIQPRTLFEVRNSTNLGPIPHGMKGPALANIRKIVKEMETLLKPLTQGAVFHEDDLKSHNVITEVQRENLTKMAANWVNLELPESESKNGVAQWLGEDLEQANCRTKAEDVSFVFDYEEVELEFEQLKELEAEGRVGDDDEIDMLKGPRVVLNEPWTGSKPRRRYTDDHHRALLNTEDLWQIGQEDRGPLYHYLQRQLKSQILKAFRQLAKSYEKFTQDLKIGRWEVDNNYLKQAKIIGCTTTGLSKYRGLLQSLDPRVVLIEEAAETLEAYVTAACFESLEHLILVGDHQQLRGHCNDEELEGRPFFLNISMFERLVRNEVSFSQLTKQRRMHPEIRRGLVSIYKEMQDHPSVMERAPVPGMGGVNTYFFCHMWPEDTDDLKSKINQNEAMLIVGFYNYLIQNGMKTQDITVLTFYNGQRKLILSGLRQHPNLQGKTFKVVTVDSYQGEENAIVLLSLVRSNRNGRIGFVEDANRVTVAISRAQRGFYIFGNAPMVCKESLLWFSVVKSMGENPRRKGRGRPVSRSILRSQLVDKLSLPARKRGQRMNRGPLDGRHQRGSANCAAQASKLDESRRGNPLVDPSQGPKSYQAGVQAYREFAAGGHIQADANTTAIAKELTAQQELQRLDEENAAALFGSNADDAPPTETGEAKLVRSRQTADGTTRNTWATIHRSQGRQSSKPQEPSLLD